MATPMLQARSRCASRVEFSAITANTTSPSCRYLRPSLRGIILHCGGKMDETRTKFCEAMPASRRASSHEVNRSLCLPTPLVKKSLFGTMLFPNFYVPSVGVRLVTDFFRTRMSLSHLGGSKLNFRQIYRHVAPASYTGSYTCLIQTVANPEKCC